MSKLGCRCGAIIYDQTDELPNKGWILRDQHYFAFFDGLAGEIADYIQARLSGNATDWVEKRFSRQYPTIERSDSDIVWNMLAGRFLETRLAMYQCQACLRVFIEDKNRKNHFFPFASDLEEAVDVLKVDKDSENSRKNDD